MYFYLMLGVGFLILFAYCYAECRYPSPTEISMKIIEDFLKAEESDQPPAGYRVIITYDKEIEIFKSKLQKFGTRAKDSEITMPVVAECPFCENDGLLLGDDQELKQKFQNLFFRIIRSNSNRILIIPTAHISHWFDFGDDEIRQQGQFAMQCMLIKMAVELCKEIEWHYPKKLTTRGTYRFEMNVGTAAMQTVPHLHLRFISGPNQGCLTDEEWKTLSSMLAN